MLEAIVFDLDNTLVNFWEFKKASAKDAAEAMVGVGLEMNAERAEKLIFKIYEEYGIEYQMTFSQMLKPFGFEREKFERIRNAGITAYLRSKAKVLRPYEGIPHTLAELGKNYKLAVLTDAPREQALKRLEFTQLQAFFGEVGTFHDTNIYKPGAEPFLYICKKLGVEPSQALMVGDNPHRDIGGAKMVGMKTCLAKYGQVYENDGSIPDYVVQKPTDLIELVGKIR